MADPVDTSKDADELAEGSAEIRWFRGQLEGYYLGKGDGKAAHGPLGSAMRYQLRIYRAQIRQVELLDEGATEELVGPEDSDTYYQASIEDTRLFGLRPRSCHEGKVYDVALAKPRFTHSTKKGDKVYGRVEGEVYARFRLPPEPEKEEAEELSHSSRASKIDPKPRANTKRRRGNDHAGRASDSVGETETMEPLHAPSVSPHFEEAEPAQVPIPLLAALMALVLGLTVGGEPALLWLGLFVPIVAIRFMMAEQFRVNTMQRVFGALLFVAQLGCLGALGLEWWTVGCKVMLTWAAIGVALTTLIGSLLPSPIPLLLLGAGYAALLFGWYGNVGVVSCDAPPVESKDVAPGVVDPGKPRTNDDGSWPRKPSPPPLAN